MACNSQIRKKHFASSRVQQLNLRQPVPEGQEGASARHAVSDSCRFLTREDVDAQLQRAYSQVSKAEQRLLEIENDKFYVHSKEYLKSQMLRFFNEKYFIPMIKKRPNFGEMEEMIQELFDKIPFKESD